MRLPFVHAAIGAICKVLATEVAFVRPYTRVQYQMSLQCLSPLERSSAYIAFKLFGIRVHQFVHVERATSIELHATGVALIVVFRMSVRVDLEDK